MKKKKSNYHFSNKHLSSKTQFRTAQKEKQKEHKRNLVKNLQIQQNNTMQKDSDLYSNYSDIMGETYLLLETLKTFDEDYDYSDWKLENDETPF